MEQYTPEERGFIVTTYLTSFRSIVLTQRDFLRRFPGRCVPCAQTIKRLADCLVQTGSTKLQNDDESVTDHSNNQNTQEGNSLGQLNTNDIQNSKKKIKDVTKSLAGDNSCRTPSTSFGKHQCFVCSYNTTEKVALIQHLQKHFTRQHHKCPVCEQTFSSRQCLRVHINGRADLRPIQCKKCDQNFTSYATLWTHNKEKHSGENPTKCTNCNFSSDDQPSLRRHMLTHVVERPHKCPQCVYATTRLCYLKAHLKRHTAEKRY